MFKTKLGLLATSALIASSAIAISANAQEDAPIIDQVIVTSAKRPQTLQEIPVAVSVTTGDTIEKANIADISDLQTVVPSLRVSQLQNSIQTTFSIRGFGNGANNPGIEPSVGVFIDGVYRARSAGAIADLPNLERVEVLRGPQSTLFGKNASAGVISIVTAKPSFVPEGSIQATYGNYNQAKISGYYTAPISDDIAFSLNGGYNKRDGYYENLEPDSEDQNDRNRWNLRGQLLFQPTDNAEFRIIADYDEIDEICCGVANLQNGPTGGAVVALGGNLVPNDPDAYAGYYDLEPFNKVTNAGISMQADFGFENFDITSISSYRDQDILFDGDVDFTSARLIAQNVQDTDTQSFSQELRIASNGDGAFDWLIGAFYYNEDLTNSTSINYGPQFRGYADTLIYFQQLAAGDPNAVLGGTLSGVEDALRLQRGTFFAEGQGLTANFTQDNNALSLFGQTDFHLSDRLTLTAGVNYTIDKKTVTSTGGSTDVFSGLDLSGDAAQGVFTAGGIAANFPALANAFGLGPLPFTPENVGRVVVLPGGAAAWTNLQAQVAGGVAAARAGGVLNVPCTTPGQEFPSCNQLLGLTPFQFLPPYLGYPNAVEDGKSEDDKITWTARIAYDVSDRINVYGSVSTGFKATTWNLSRDSRPPNLAAVNGAGLGLNNLNQGTRLAGPEESTVFELGLKARFDRGTLNVAVFDQDIDGFQSNAFTGTGFSLVNAGKQTVKGFEVESTWNPVDPVDLTFAATYLDPEYDSFIGGRGVNGPEDLSGTRPAGIATLSVSMSATYSHEFANGMDGFIRGDFMHESDVPVIETVPENVASRTVDILNASAGVTTESGWGVMLWARNLTDQSHIVQAFPSVAQAGSYSGYPNPPRTYGITLKKDFK